MKRFIFGFHRRVWCPKWTPLSSSFRMVTTATASSPLSPGCPAVRSGRRLAPGRRPWVPGVLTGTRAADASPWKWGKGARGRPHEVVAGDECTPGTVPGRRGGGSAGGGGGGSAGGEAGGDEQGQAERGEGAGG